MTFKTNSLVIRSEKRAVRLLLRKVSVDPELSLFALCDGQKAVLIPTAAQDHKRLLNDDYGPNTGGMGCYSPLPELSSQDLERLMDVAVHPTVNELKNRGIDYRGVLCGIYAHRRRTKASGVQHSIW